MNPFHCPSLIARLTLPTVIVLAGATAGLASETDLRIEAAIKGSYNFQTFLKADRVQVACADGVVTLSGCVAEDFHRSLLEQTACEMPGVKRVANQITVYGPQPAPGSDPWITLKVKASLAFHKNVSATATEVTTAAGVVTLAGTVDSAAEKELAGEYAKDVDQVKAVVNQLAVAPAANPTHESVGKAIDDMSITAQIKTALLFHKSVRAMATKVITRGGNVSLHGEAKSEAERSLVGKLASEIKGVRKVNNHMTVAKS